MQVATNPDGDLVPVAATRDAEGRTADEETRHLLREILAEMKAVRVGLEFALRQKLR